MESVPDSPLPTDDFGNVLLKVLELLGALSLSAVDYVNSESADSYFVSKVIRDIFCILRYLSLSDHFFSYCLTKSHL